MPSKFSERAINRAIHIVTTIIAERQEIVQDELRIVKAELAELVAFAEDIVAVPLTSISWDGA